MRSAGILREASRNVGSGTSRAGILFLVATALLGAILVSDILAISNTVRQAVEFRDSGAAVETVAAPGRVNGTSCEALAQIPDVIAAGAMRKLTPEPLVTLPGSPVEYYETSPSFAAVLGATDRGGAGIFVSHDVRADLATDTVPLRGRNVDVRGSYVYPIDGRRAGFGWAVLVPTLSTSNFDECWVLSWPQRPEIRQLLLTTVTSAAETPGHDEPQISQLNARYGTTSTAAGSYATRPTRWSAILAAAAAALLALVAVRIRRVEIAADLHAGARRAEIVLQHLVEGAIWTVPAAVLAWALGVLVAVQGAPSELACLSLHSAQISFAFVAGAAFGASVGLLGIRERGLWRYVKGS